MVAESEEKSRTVTIYAVYSSADWSCDLPAFPTNFTIIADLEKSNIVSDIPFILHLINHNYLITDCEKCPRVVYGLQIKYNFDRLKGVT